MWRVVGKKNVFFSSQKYTIVMNKQDGGNMEAGRG